MTDHFETLRSNLLNWFSQFPGVLVAFSGGVDSAVVAFAAQQTLGSRAMAVTADSPSLARFDFAQACELAQWIGIRHQVVQTEELLDSQYARNDAQRCYHCKSHLFSSLQSINRQLPSQWIIVTGTNADDLGDYRPGLRAADDFAVRSPLSELGITKALVRKLSAAWNLPVADKPASPCLASRIAYGLEVTPQRLQMVELAEAVLRALGIVEFRVRLHTGDLARIEVDVDWLVKLVQPDIRAALTRRFREIGFKFITLDTEGFRSGNLNQLVTSIDFISR